MDQADNVYYVFKLMDRGLTADDIGRAMAKMIGADWKTIKVSAWLQRFKSGGYISQLALELTVDDLEALVLGNLKLDRIKDAGPGR